MSVETLLALMGFAFVTSVTPGPVNLILLASGAAFGFRRSAHLAFACTASLLAIILLVGLGLGQVLQASEGLGALLKLFSLLFILWLAWRIARSAGIGREQHDARPVSFLEMSLLQWVNPKAWAVAIAVTAAYTTPDNYHTSLLSMTLIFGAVNLPSVGCWAAFGTVLRRWLRDPVRARAFNLVMAVLLVASMLPVVLDLAILGALF